MTDSKLATVSHFHCSSFISVAKARSLSFGYSPMGLHSTLVNFSFARKYYTRVKVTDSRLAIVSHFHCSLITVDKARSLAFKYSSFGAPHHSLRGQLCSQILD